MTDNRSIYQVNYFAHILTSSLLQWPFLTGLWICTYYLVVGYGKCRCYPIDFTADVPTHYGCLCRLDTVPHPLSMQRDPSQLFLRARCRPTPFEHGDRPTAGVCACLMPFEHGETPTHLPSSRFKQRWPPHHPLLLKMQDRCVHRYTSILLCNLWFLSSHVNSSSFPANVTNVFKMLSHSEKQYLAIQSCIPLKVYIPLYFLVFAYLAIYSSPRIQSSVKYMELHDIYDRQNGTNRNRNRFWSVI